MLCQLGAGGGGHGPGVKRLLEVIGGSLSAPSPFTPSAWLVMTLETVVTLCYPLAFLFPTHTNTHTCEPVLQESWGGEKENLEWNTLSRIMIVTLPTAC